MKIKELKELLANAGDNDNIEVVNNKFLDIYADFCGCKKGGKE